MSNRQPEDSVRCEEHDCPMLRIEDEYVCILEYMDEHLGGKQVKDLIVVEDGPIAILFDDDHELPLLCPHCGDPIEVDADELLNELSGLYLAALQWVPADGEADEYEGVELLFAADPDVDVDLLPDDADVHAIVLHPNSAWDLVCPGL